MLQEYTAREGARRLTPGPPLESVPQPKILIVDDETEVVLALTMRLTSAGYTVISAKDGVMATLTALDKAPDLVILDIGLPYGDGHAVAACLRNNLKTMFTPIIFLTARTGKGDEKKAQQAHPAGYLTKPYKAQELLYLISKSLKPSEQE